MGNKVMLDARYIKTIRPSVSLDHKNLGPYEVIRVIDNNSACELKLPDSIKGVYPVFYIWLLHLDRSNLLPRQVIDPPPPIEVNDEGEEHEVLEVINSKINNRRKDPLTNKKGCLIYKILYPNSDIWNARPLW